MVIRGNSEIFLANFEQNQSVFISNFNPFLVNVSHFILPWKHRKNQIFSGVSKGYEVGTLARNELTLSCMLQNGQTYFKNLALFTPQDF